MEDLLEAAFPPLTLSVRTERWPLRETFTISRGSKTEAQVVVAEVAAEGFVGRGECIPYARYGETVESVEAALLAAQPALRSGLNREQLQKMMPAGAARNALDCALWDFEAKSTGVPVWQRAGLSEPKTVRTAFTISLAGAPEMTRKAAEAAQTHTLLKLKLAGDAQDIERLAAVRRAVPDTDLIADVNEGCTPQTLPAFLAACEKNNLLLIEQPLPAGGDEPLAGYLGAVVICADESAHTAMDITSLAKKYGAVNIKLDKTGGFTEALRMHRAARAAGMRIMVGCMVSTSLSMAPAMLLASDAEYVDLDGALLLAHDREQGLLYEGDTVAPPTSALWG